MRQRQRAESFLQLLKKKSRMLRMKRLKEELKQMKCSA